MDNGKKVCRITGIFQSGMATSIIEALKPMGIVDFHLAAARSIMLHEKKALFGMVSNTVLVEDPADILTFLVDNCRLANRQLNSVAELFAMVDVLAEFRDPRDPTDVTGPFSPRGGHGFVFKVIVECKFWKRRIPQEKIFALKTIVSL